MENNNLQKDAINTLRFLSADMIQEANSGHPGLPMGCATLAFTIWTRHLRHNPRNPSWPGRDRFILSGGHGSALLYSLLYLTGYDITINDLKNFRKLGSKTPGHPEYGVTPGVEVTTGPLGQGFANGVGMAIAEAHLAALFNNENNKIYDSFFYAIVTDGDLMEGISSEAASLAGHLRLGKLIYLYDNNHISIDGPTELTFSEKRGERFAAFGWHVVDVADGDDVEEIDQAIISAKTDPRPSLICCRTVIGKGLPNRQGTNRAHGEPPGIEELNQAKRNIGWPTDSTFYIPSDVKSFFRQALNHGKAAEFNWENKLRNMQTSQPQKYNELLKRLYGHIPEKTLKLLPTFLADNKGMATRVASSIIINHLAETFPQLVGGSADLTPSTKTWISCSSSFQYETPEGRNFHFGVREHAMGAILNGMAVFGGLIPFGATFLVFSDYMRTPLRLSALSGYPVIWIFTHDSIGVGEDGPTHQPIEHLASLRAIPGMVVLRPSDANETAEAWKVALSRRKGPTCLILTRQDLPIIDRSTYAEAEGLKNGAYILSDPEEGKPEIILMASGSEVQIMLEVRSILIARSIKVRTISFPSWEIFVNQSQDYKNLVLPPAIIPRLAIEAGVKQGWEQWTGTEGEVISIEKFGASAPYLDLYEKYDFTINGITKRALCLLGKNA